MPRTPVVVLALLALAACSSDPVVPVPPSGSIPTVSSSGSSSAPSSPSTPGFPSTSASSPTTSSSRVSFTPPAPPSTSSTTTAPPPVQNATRDIVNVRYKIPAGWRYGKNYRLNNPAETSYNLRILVPRGTSASTNLDAISIVLYRLPGSVDVTSPPAQLARLKYYNRRAGAAVQDRIKRTVIAGYPALQENAVEQGASQTYRYAAWFVFGRRHVLAVACQVDEKVNKVASACQTVIDSLRLR